MLMDDIEMFGRQSALEMESAGDVPSAISAPGNVQDIGGKGCEVMQERAGFAEEPNGLFVLRVVDAAHHGLNHLADGCVIRSGVANDVQDALHSVGSVLIRRLRRVKMWVK